MHVIVIFVSTFSATMFSRDLFFILWITHIVFLRLVALIAPSGEYKLKYCWRLKFLHSFTSPIKIVCMQSCTACSERLWNKENAEKCLLTAGAVYE